MSSPARKEHAKRNLDELLHRLAELLGHSREPFWRLIHAIRASSQLLVPLPRRGRTDPMELVRILAACGRIPRYAEHWCRPPETWSAPAGSPFVQFRSLVSHLFDRYPVPGFMAEVWCCTGEKPWEPQMYLHLARGHSIRRFTLPVPCRLSKRAAGFFMQAPDDLHPVQAMQWGRIRALGGDGRLARLLVSKTVLAAPSEHDEFWDSVVRFLVNNGPICEEEIVAIVGFIHQQRFQPADRVLGLGAGPEPLQPDFRLRGRSLMWLRRHMTNWRAELIARLPPLADSTPAWGRTNIGPFRAVLGDSLWTIDELLSDRELRIEGGIMQHCVVSYIHQCARRRTSIWSLKRHRDGQSRRVLTIEVAPATKRILQASGRRNAAPDGAAREILGRWARDEGLRLADAT